MDLIRDFTLNHGRLSFRQSSESYSILMRKINMEVELLKNTPEQALNSKSISVSISLALAYALLFATKETINKLLSFFASTPRLAVSERTACFSLLIRLYCYTSTYVIRPKVLGLTS